MQSSSKRGASSKEGARGSKSASKGDTGEATPPVKGTPFHLRYHEEKMAVEVVFPFKPRLTLCLSTKMTLGEAAQRIIERYEKGK